MSREDDSVVGALIDLCRKHNIRCVVQVGAEDGYEAAEIAKAIGCRAIALDADYKCEPVQGIEYHHQMIGAYNGEADFYKNVMLGLSSAVQRHSANGEERVARQQMRLDTFCRENNIEPDALIIDTEGTTMDVLLGAGNLLATLKLAYLEVNHDDSRGDRADAKVIDQIMTANRMVRHAGPPSYSAGAQSNWTWVKNG